MQGGAGLLLRPAPVIRVASRNRVIVDPFAQNLVHQGDQVPAPFVVRGEEGRQKSPQGPAGVVSEQLPEFLVTFALLLRSLADPAAGNDGGLEPLQESDLPLRGEIRRMESDGARLTTTEMALFELKFDCRGEAFRKLSRLVK
jgi:hypothetical protein